MFTRALLLLLLFGSPASAAPADEALLRIEDRWAEISYEIKDKNERLAVARVLVAQTQALAGERPGQPGPLVWWARALVAEAEVRGDLSALRLIKQARRLLEQAEKIDPRALGGMIQTSLGMLYYEAPGWPIAFGDKARAQAYLTEALKIDPGGQESNYVFGDYLVMTGRGREAIPFLESALAAPPRPGHARADQGRRADIQESLDKARKSR